MCDSGLLYLYEEILNLNNMMKRIILSFIASIPVLIANAQIPDLLPPTDTEPLELTPFNIIIYIILPVIIFVIYFWYRKSKRKKKNNRTEELKK